jgi:hypothetical protein
MKKIFLTVGILTTLCFSNLVMAESPVFDTLSKTDRAQIELATVVHWRCSCGAHTTGRAYPGRGTCRYNNGGHHWVRVN